MVSWFAHSIRWVLMTALGEPVEPEVKRNFAMVSGPTPAWAVSTALDGSTTAISANKWLVRPGTGWRVTISGTSGGTTASIAAAKRLPSAANTRPGVKRP